MIEVRDELFPFASGSLPRHLISIGPHRSLVGVLRHALVRKTYRYPTIDRRYADYDLTRYEIWFANVLHWYRQSWSRLDDLGKLTISDRMNLRLEATTRCTPAGHLFRIQKFSLRRYCALPMCPFCHARSVSKLACELTDAYKKRPRGSRCYVGVWHRKGVLDTEWVSKWLRRHRLAGVSVFRHLYSDSKSPTGYFWYYHIVGISDDAQRIRDAEATPKLVAKYGDVFRVVAASMEWPHRWQIPEHLLSDVSLYDVVLGYKSWKYRSFGACMKSFRPGKAWLDFKGFEPRADGTTRRTRKKKETEDGPV